MLGSVSDPGGEGMSLLQWRGPRRALAGLATGRLSTIGAGMLAASRSATYSEFLKVKEVIAIRRANVIKVNETLGHNQVYAENSDFDFVLNYIREHTPHAKQG